MVYLLFLLFSSLFCLDFPIYQLLHYAKGTEEFGCVWSRMTGDLGLLDSRSQSRRVVLLTFAELMELIEMQSSWVINVLCEKKDILGLLIIAPPPSFQATQEEKTMFWEFERYVAGQKFEKPIYITPYSDEVMELYDGLSRSPSSFSLRAYKHGSVPNFMAKKTENFDTLNLYGSMSGNSGTRTIVFVASWDSLTIFPQYPNGAGVSDSASGMLALFELARYFRMLYSNEQTRGEDNLLFVLTASAGSAGMPFEGSKHFVKKLNKIVDGISSASSNSNSEPSESKSKQKTKNGEKRGGEQEEKEIIVVCLDDLAGTLPLNVHVSKKVDNDNFVNLLSSFVSAAGEGSGSDSARVVLTPLTRSSGKSFEHAVYQRKNFPAVTLSTRTASAVQNGTLLSASLLDTELDWDRFAKNVFIVAEGVSRWIFGHGGLFREKYVKKSVVDNWINALTTYHRAAPYIYSTTDKGSSPGGEGEVIVSGIKKTMGKYMKVRAQHFTAVQKIQFYEDRSDAVLNVRNVRPLPFQILVLLAVFGYLVGLFVWLKGIEEAKKIFGGFLTKVKNE